MGRPRASRPESGGLATRRAAAHRGASRPESWGLATRRAAAHFGASPPHDEGESPDWLVVLGSEPRSNYSSTRLSLFILCLHGYKTIIDRSCVGHGKFPVG